MNSNLRLTSTNPSSQFPPPLLRTKTHILSICQNLTFQSLQTRLNCNYHSTRNITHLNLSSNKISKIPNILFKSITTLNVSRCHLNNSCVIQLEQLQKLDISHNCLTIIPEIKSLKLQYLNISHNQITTLPKQLLRYQKLQELKCSHNLLSNFDINVIKQHYSKNTDIVKLIDLNRLQTIEDGVYSARYLIQRSYPTLSQQSRRKLLIQAIKRQYSIGISILSQKIKLQQQIAYIQFCQSNGFNKSLQTLLISFKITNNYDTCRVQSLNPQLFKRQNSLAIKSLILTLEQNIQKRYQKCQQFVTHLVKIGKSIVNSETLMDIVSCGNPEIVYLLFKYEKQSFDDMELNHSNPHLIKLLLQLDHSKLLALLFQIPIFSSLLQLYINTSSICSLLTPKFKIYKLLSKYQRQILSHQISKKSIPETNIYTTTSMYSLGDSEQMIEYYQMQDPHPEPAEVIIKMNQVKDEEYRSRGKENLMVTRQIQNMRKTMQSTMKPKKLGLTLNRSINN